MNQLNEITDDEFIPFLLNLGVDTYKKSFEWMLNDPDFSEVLRWLYKSLDHNNALTPREEYRYSEIEVRQKVLSETDLEASIKSIQEEFEGICLPGELDKLNDVKLNINFQKEKLHVLEKQQNIIQDLIVKNEAIKDEVTVEVTHLHAAQQQCAEDEKTAGDECLQLAEEAEAITEEVMDIVTNALDLIGRTQSEKDIAKMFFTFGPFETYRQSQALFRSHFDLYTSKMFQKTQHDELSDEELKNILVEAKTLEERLSDAAYVYIESKAELAGELSKLELVSNYIPVHPNQILGSTMEAESALGLLRQEQCVAEQQGRAALAGLRRRRRDALTGAVAAAAAAARDHALAAGAALRGAGARALAADRAALACARAALRRLAELLHFADSLRDFSACEQRARRERADFMNKIIAEQALSEEKLDSNDCLLSAVSRAFSLEAPVDAPAVVRMHEELKLNIKDLKFAVEEKFRKKEESLEEFKRWTLRLAALARRGRDGAGARLAARLRRRLAAAERRVLCAGAAYSQVKNGDKHNLRKLWQWFLAEPARLQAAVNQLSVPSYS